MQAKEYKQNATKQNKTKLMGVGPYGNPLLDFPPNGCRHCNVAHMELKGTREMQMTLIYAIDCFIVVLGA